MQFNHLHGSSYEIDEVIHWYHHSHITFLYIFLATLCNWDQTPLKYDSVSHRCWNEGYCHTIRHSRSFQTDAKRRLLQFPINL